jgi:hypothetical protein
MRPALRRPWHRFRPALLAGLLTVLFAAPAGAQRYAPRVGVGFEVMAALPSQDVVPEGLGVGLRTRLSVPVNRDLSVAGDVGLAGFVLGGQDDATYLFNPQLDVILSLPARDAVRYLFGGLGGFIPLGDGDGFDEPSGGPALHLGIGWAFPLSETSLFVEINPSLIVGPDETTVVLPARAGVIF